MTYKVHGQTSWNNSKTKKQTFIDEIFAITKKEKFKNLAPSSYKADKAYDESTMRGYKRFQWNKEPRNSFVTIVQKREKGMKGPADYADYKAEKHIKIKGNYHLKERSGQLMDEVEFTSAQSPGSNHYKKMDVGVLSQNPKSPGAMLNRDKSDRKSVFEARGGAKESPGPAAYKGVDTNWKQMSPFKANNSTYTIPKTKFESFVDIHTKKKNIVPGVAKYSDSITILDKISKGASPHYKRGR
jgi:hypothetical protein